MSESTPGNRCGYTYPEEYEIGDYSGHPNCCWRETVEDSEECIWHQGIWVGAYGDDRIRAFEDYSIRRHVRQASSPYSELLDGASLSKLDLGDDLPFTDVALRQSDLRDINFSEANFVHADLLEARLHNVDFSGARLTGVNFSRTNCNDVNFSGADLDMADYSNADLISPDFTNTDLSSANFSNANLIRPNFTDADLVAADLSAADISRPNFSDGDLRSANLSGARLVRAELSGTDLSGADLNGVDLRLSTIENVSVDGSTTCKYLYEGFERDRIMDNRLSRFLPLLPRWLSGESDFDPEDWDRVARAYHHLKAIFNESGLVGKARRLHLRERGARRSEAKAGGDGLGWFFSWLAWQTTGYGVSVRRLARNMVLVFSISTITYLWLGISENFSTGPEILYYSLITFTTTPPEMPDSLKVKAVVMVEAFLGTLLVVFLGYILGTREQF